MNEFLGISDFGPDNLYLLNKDLNDPKKSVTEAQTTKAFNSVSKSLREEPKQTRLGIVYVGGHGMMHEGTQHFVLNQYDKDKRFYKLFPVEAKIRHVTYKHNNCYMIAIMACSRDSFNQSQILGVDASLSEES